MNGTPLNTLLSEKKYPEIEAAFLAALEDPAADADFLVSAAKGLARAGQKARLQTLANAAESSLRPKSGDVSVARLRWTLLKEAVRGGATPTSPTGFQKLFEDVLKAAYPDSPSLTTLLGRFKFAEAKDPADGLARIERAEKWLPFEVGRCFSMPGRGAGRVTEMNFALDSIRVDFEAAKGIAVPIGVAAKNLIPLPDGHFLREKLTDPAGLAAKVKADPAGTIQRLVASYGRAISLTELKEAVSGLVAEDGWTSWWAAAKREPRVVTHGSGKTATLEWTDSVGSADEALLRKFEKSSVKDKLDLYKKNAKRSVDLEASLGRILALEAARVRAEEPPARAFEIGVLLEKSVSGGVGFILSDLVVENPLPLLSAVGDRAARERLLEIYSGKFPEKAAQVMADWMLKEEDSRTIEALDRKLADLDPAARERTLDRLLKSPRSGPRAFVWFAQKALSDEALRRRLNPNVLARLLDAVSWDELGALRTKVREMFDRTSLGAIWLMKQATLEETRTFLDALARHHELEPHRRDGLLAAAEMRFPELRKSADDTFFATPESLEKKRQELEQIIKVDIPENTKGIALAAAEGDLSENFEYKARRDRQQLLSARAGKLQEELGKVRVLDPGSIDTSEIRPGTRVTLDVAGVSRVVTLLGPWDSRPEDGIYSYLSDLGKALLGKTVGDAVEVLGEPATVVEIAAWR